MRDLMLLFSSTVATAGVCGGAEGDSMVFAGAVSNSTIDLGVGNDSVSFGSVHDKHPYRWFWR